MAPAANPQQPESIEHELPPLVDMLVHMKCLMQGIPVRHDCLRVCPESLNEAEDVVPATAVEACAVLPQLKKNLIHLKGSWQGLNQHSCLHTTQVQQLIMAENFDISAGLYSASASSIARMGATDSDGYGSL